MRYINIYSIPLTYFHQIMQYKDCERSKKDEVGWGRIPVSVFIYTRIIKREQFLLPSIYEIVR